LSRFRFINRFKPLLDAYQGPYKINYYYFTGVQLLIRVIFFGVSSLERNTNLVLGIVLLSIIICIHGIISPLKNKVKHFQEMLYITNLQILYTIALYDHQVISVIVNNVLFGFAAFHFTLIVMYHTITYSCNDRIKAKIQLRITRLSEWVARWTFLSTSYNQQHLELQDHNTQDVIPEVINYDEYQEALLNEDY